MKIILRSKDIDKEFGLISTLKLNRSNQIRLGGKIS